MENKYKIKPTGQGIGFQRIRRVTGYLTDTVRMNDSKRKEVSERVKHTEETSTKK